MIYIIDTYAWIEYFKGSSEGKLLAKLFDNLKDKFITLECCIAEIKCYCLKHEANFDFMFGVIKSNSVILPVMLDNWLNAADLREEYRKKGNSHFGLIDAILVSKQKELDCKIISGDKHFSKLTNILFMKS